MYKCQVAACWVKLIQAVPTGCQASSCTLKTSVCLLCWTSLCKCSDCFCRINFMFWQDQLIRKPTQASGTQHHLHGSHRASRKTEHSTWNYKSSFYLDLSFTSHMSWASYFPSLRLQFLICNARRLESTSWYLPSVTSYILGNWPPVVLKICMLILG